MYANKWCGMRTKFFFNLNKKADLVGMTLEVLVALLIICGLTALFVYQEGRIANNDAFERTYTAENTALLLDAIYASPNSMNYVYSSYLSNQQIMITEGYVRVYKPGQTISTGVVAASRFGYSNFTKLITSSLNFYNGSTINFLIVQVPKKITIVNSSSILDAAQNTISCPVVDTHLDILNTDVLIDRLASSYTSNQDLYKGAFSLLQMLANDNYMITTKSVLQQTDFNQVLEDSKNKKLYILIVDKTDLSSSVHIMLKQQSLAFDKFFCLFSNNLKTAGFTVTKDYGFTGDYDKYNQISSQYAIIIEYNTNDVFKLSEIIKNSIGGFFQ